MKICIDTNIYTACKKGDTEILGFLEEADEVLVPSVVLGELYAGFYIGKLRAKNIGELEEFLDVPGIHVVEINKSIAEKYGYLIKALRDRGTPIPTNDVWIAATALESSAKILSLDKHFDYIPGIINVL